MGTETPLRVWRTARNSKGSEIVSNFRLASTSPTTPLQDGTVQSQNHGSRMNLPIKSNIVTYVTTKDGCNVLFGKEIIISEPTPKIGNNSMKPKQLNVVNTDKTRSKHTLSQFLLQILLTMTQRIVTMSN